MYKIYVHNLRKQDEGKVKAYADVTVGNAVTLKGIKLIDGENGVFVAMPSRKYERDGDEKYSDIFYPKSDDARTTLLETFQKAHESDDGYAYSNGDVNPELNVTVKPVDKSSTSLVAWATLNIGDDFIVRNIAVNRTSKGFMVDFPSVKYEKDGEEKYSALVVPKNVEWTDKDGKVCSKDYNKLITGLIINEYKPTLSNQIADADKSKKNSRDIDKGNTQKDIEM